MGTYQDVYKQLNPAQRKAVDLIDGPLLVLAGPGTGKTQLLSARVANILQKTDTLPQNILCLTFTEAAAHNMRERLQSMIGEDAYDVHIATYHSFGSDIIRTYPSYFSSVNLETGEDSRLERPIDDLTKTQIVSDIVQRLAYDDPLRSARYYIKSVVSVISDLKKSLLSPDQLRKIAYDNSEAVVHVSPIVNEALSGLVSLRKFDDSLQAFSALQHRLKNDHHALVIEAVTALEAALDTAEETHKTTTLTAWKNDWLTKDNQDTWVFTSVEQHQKMAALAHIFEAYQAQLEARALYDFDDMILKTIDVLKHNAELRFNLQERYQFILLDEFQDTNPAQFEMVHILADHPVHEGRPNIMAVGDDDQAIYAFQGAEVSNMLKFTKSFKDVEVINLDKNYRSHHDIIHVAHQVSEQIETRLHEQLEGVSKQLSAARSDLPKIAVIERHEFSAQASEYGWVGEKIEGLIKHGVVPSQIAVLSPKHRLLEQLVPFLNAVDIPVTYEKRENILETPIIKQLRLLAELTLACAEQDMVKASEFFPQVLSLDFWNNTTEDIWKVNWVYAKRDEKRSWAEIAIEQGKLKEQILFFLAIANKTDTLPLEYMLDLLTGVESIAIDKQLMYRSPLKDFYFGHDIQMSQQYYEALSHLSVIRERLRDHQKSEESLMSLSSFIDFFKLYEDAEQPLTNSHPIAQAEDSVQLMTVYKAKGLEFEYVFLLSVHDDVWGRKSRNDSNKIGLPANLNYIRYRGSGEDELKRLLFVAVTRAKHGLFMTSHALKETGKATEPVKYLQEQLDDDGERMIRIFPSPHDKVIYNKKSVTAMQTDIQLLWQQRHVTITPTLKNLLADRIAHYQMSPTHLNSFVDLQYSGPQEFLLRTLLRFPSAPTVDGEYGNSIHNSLEWYASQEILPSISELLKHYSISLKRFYIPKHELTNIDARGRKTLQAYLNARTKMFAVSAKSEVDFRKEGVVLHHAKLTGKIDRLEIDQATKTVRIVDYKTGESFTTWKSIVKLHKYRQQLYFYKLLVEKSHSYSGYRVADARLEFVEPRADGTVAPPLLLSFDEREYEHIKQLVGAVWQHIQSLSFPSVEAYSSDMSGVREFESFLTESTQK